MKKKLYLQMFAEAGAGEGAAATQGAATEGNTGAGTQTQQQSQTEGGKQGKSEAKYTDEDLDRVINQKFAEWQKKQQKAVDEAAKLAKMDAQQKAEYERDQLQKELDALKKKDSLSEMTKTARKMLSDKGVTVNDDVLAMLVNTNAEETKAAVDAFATAFSAAVEAAVKERLKGNPPKKGSGGGTVAVTKDQILAIKDPEERQKKMLEHRDLFNF